MTFPQCIQKIKNMKSGRKGYFRWQDEKEKAIKHVLFQIELIDAKRTKYLLKEQAKLHKKAVVEQ